MKISKLSLKELQALNISSKDFNTNSVKGEINGKTSAYIVLRNEDLSHILRDYVKSGEEYFCQIANAKSLRIDCYKANSENTLCDLLDFLIKNLEDMYDLLWVLDSSQSGLFSKIDGFWKLEHTHSFPRLFLYDVYQRTNE